MSITINSIPEELKSDKDVTSYIQRAIELEEAEPIISYYSKIYVLEHILNNKLHTKSKSTEEFTIGLLDNTEAIKQNSSDEDLKKILNDKNLSFGYIFKFAYTLFNSCLENLNNYQISSKNQLISKFKAAMCFLSLLTIFESSEDEIEFEKFTGGKINNWNDFNKLNKEKLKILKYQLTRIIKDEIDVGKSEEIDDKELEEELNKELDQLSTVNNDEINNEQEPQNFDSQTNNQNEENNDTKFNLPGAPKDLPSEKGHDDHDSIELPGAPHVAPDEDSNLGLPKTPKYLPDDDITNINKSGSIHVFASSPDQPESKIIPEKKPSVSRVSSQQHHKPLSKENIKQILNRDDAITQIQKHTKFASSALQFEDFDEAEKQLIKGLELLRSVKNFDNSS
ncbi:uncharacterized protein KGF55_002439 [Candida pseudojiufengensis]|uniref:uncharacterized protein n=1 Tax=Candida pseudojiufengensis TaxID=497109 RepID=UPI0022245C6A|nr:uncharacterized protein KGF55_002439 [Candida pseudojiufengensis]KAI5963559.1 hypothetical protein KGF55_002439 [Candida pseudojiufengensis]